MDKKLPDIMSRHEQLVDKMRGYRPTEEGFWPTVGVTVSDVVARCDTAGRPLDPVTLQLVEQWGDDLNKIYGAGTPGQLADAYINCKLSPDLSNPEDFNRIQCQQEACYGRRNYLPSGVADPSNPHNPFTTGSDIAEYLTLYPDTKLAQHLTYCGLVAPDYQLCLETQPPAISLAATDYSVYDNGGAGDCFFLALITWLKLEQGIATWLPSGDPEAMDLRNKTVNWIAEHRNFRLPYYNMTVEDNIKTDRRMAFDRYVTEMKRVSCQAGGPEYYATAFILQRQLVILGHDRPGRYKYKYYSPKFSDLPAVILIHTGSSQTGHYQTLYPTNPTNPIKPAKTTKSMKTAIAPADRQAQHTVVPSWLDTLVPASVSSPSPSSSSSSSSSVKRIDPATVALAVPNPMLRHVDQILAAYHIGIEGLADSPSREELAIRLESLKRQITRQPVASKVQGSGGLTVDDIQSLLDELSELGSVKIECYFGQNADAPYVLFYETAARGSRKPLILIKNRMKYSVVV